MKYDQLQLLNGLKLQNSRFTALAIGVIAFGIIPLVTGLDLTTNADKHIHEIQKKETVDLERLMSINITPTYDTEEKTPVKYVKVNFDTTVIFEGDTIGLTATGIDVDPEVIAIYLFITEPDDDITKYSGEDLGREINSAKAFNQIIELFPTTVPPFYSRTEIPFLKAYQNINIQGVWVKDESNYGYMISGETILTVHPRTDKLLAETNSAVMEQIYETKISTQQQKKTNDVILGLTWIGLAAIPILVGTDILLRIYLKQKIQS